jgi:hypothetical protein
MRLTILNNLREKSGPTIKNWQSYSNSRLSNAPYGTGTTFPLYYSFNRTTVLEY